ncbi:MAG: dTDP-4-dehydrorhamnose reductase [Myxococcota bacterium]|jgi:dTDP-4-dehydrorhamnose reductase
MGRSGPDANAGVLRWVVVGAEGLLGRAVCRVLRHREGNAQVVALSRMACDIRSSEAVDRACTGADVIVNCAGWTNVDSAEAQRAEAFAVNAAGARNVAETARRLCARAVHVSTDYVFDGLSPAPYDVDGARSPINVYGQSKMAGEDAVLSLGAPLQLLVRVQALYGAGGRGFPSRLGGLLARGSEGLRLDAERRIQPTWVTHAADQIVALVEAEQAGTFHVSSKGETTWAEFAAALATQLGVPADFAPVSSEAMAYTVQRPAMTCFSHRSLSEAGCDQMPHWRDGVSAYVAHLGATP